MNYRFIKVTNYYKNFLSYYYQKNPGIVQLSYQDQYTHIMNEAFGWSNFYQLHLNKLGNDAYELIANAKPLQTSWAKEHDFNYSGDKKCLKFL